MAGFATFTDPLTATTQNTGLWGGNFGTLSWAAQGFTITNPSAYTGYGGQSSISSYDLTGASCWVNIANLGSQVLASCESVPIDLNFSSSTNRLFFYANAGTLTAYKTIASTQTSVASATYSATTHKWLAISEGLGRKSGTGVAGTIYFEYSADGITWSLFTSLANPFAVTALFVDTSLGTYASEASSTTLKINSYNTSAATVNKGAGFFSALMT